VLSEPRLIVPGIDGVLPSPHIDTTTTETNASVPQKDDMFPPPKISAEEPEGARDVVLPSGNLDQSKRPRIDDNGINHEVLDPASAVRQGPPFGPEEGKERTGKKKKGNKEKHRMKP
jgi:hypothetical protein